ncbi:Hypothetical predicted protein [Cloeon dipterum]|uniref:Uncharacterized protein n=1 Tax=Cloeon dipterum TaxID=197152 RepID=A0A8S1DKX6_9INSE|nr:Hypothetical predicted protein [Cloeon dipterum]
MKKLIYRCKLEKKAAFVRLLWKVVIDGVEFVTQMMPTFGWTLVMLAFMFVGNAAYFRYNNIRMSEVILASFLVYGLLILYSCFVVTRKLGFGKLVSEVSCLELKTRLMSAVEDEKKLRCLLDCLRRAQFLFAREISKRMRVDYPTLEDIFKLTNASSTDVEEVKNAKDRLPEGITWTLTPLVQISESLRATNTDLSRWAHEELSKIDRAFLLMSNITTLSKFIRVVRLVTWIAMQVFHLYYIMSVDIGYLFILFAHHFLMMEFWSVIVGMEDVLGDSTLGDRPIINFLWRNEEILKEYAMEISIIAPQKFQDI